jgi:hypothetical protein
MHVLRAQLQKMHSHHFISTEHRVRQINVLTIEMFTQFILFYTTSSWDSIVDIVTIPWTG